MPTHVRVNGERHEVPKHLRNSKDGALDAWIDSLRGDETFEELTPDVDDVDQEVTGGGAEQAE